MDLHILSDPVTDLWSAPKRGLKITFQHFLPRGHISVDNFFVVVAAAASVAAAAFDFSLAILATDNIAYIASATNAQVP